MNEFRDSGRPLCVTSLRCSDVAYYYVLVVYIRTGAQVRINELTAVNTRAVKMRTSSELDIVGLVMETTVSIVLNYSKTVCINLFF